MPMNAVYRGPGDLADVIPVFPLPGALLLPRGQMPLNIFEPRYLAMIDDALRDGHRLIGMIQPDTGASRARRTSRNLFKVGCVGRITQFAETGDGRYLIQLTGIARFRVEEELVGADALSAMPRHLRALRRRFRRPQRRGRGRPQGAAATRCRRSSRPTSSRPTGRASRTRPTRRWSTRSP